MIYIASCCKFRTPNEPRIEKHAHWAGMPICLVFSIQMRTFLLEQLNSFQLIAWVALITCLIQHEELVVFRWCTCLGWAWNCHFEALKHPLVELCALFAAGARHNSFCEGCCLWSVCCSGTQCDWYRQNEGWESTEVLLLCFSTGCLLPAGEIGTLEAVCDLPRY